MNNKISNTEKFYEFIKLIGYITIGGVAVFFFKDRLEGKEDIIKAKDAQIETLKILQPSNVNQSFEALKKHYDNQIDFYRKKIIALESSGNNNLPLIDTYKKRIFELETKLNILNQVSDDVTKKMAEKLGHDLKFTEIHPFSFFEFPYYDFDANGYRDSLIANYYMFYAEYQAWEASMIVDSGYSFDYRYGPYGLKGHHSPLFYSFDSVDLRTATFKNADLRGVDLSSTIIDSETKFPK